MNQFIRMLRLTLWTVAPAVLHATLTGDPNQAPGTRSTLQFMAIGGIACIALDRLMGLRKKR